jgi:D-inositol-3-phosphate glycosyltransferase
MHRLVVISLNGDPLAELGREHAGGQCRYVLEITKRLAGHGWSSTVFTIRNGDAPTHEQVGAALSVWRIPLVAASSYEPEACLNEIQSVTEAIANVIQVQSVPVDVILGCYWLSGLAAVAVGRMLVRRTIMSFCSLGVYKEAFAGAPAMARRVALERQVATDADHIIATTSVEAGTLHSAYGVDPRKISIIPRGIDLDVFRPLP